MANKGFELMNVMGFDFNGSSVTTIVDNENQAWFIGKEIGELLGYAKARNAIERHVYKEDKKIVNYADIKEFLTSPKMGLVNKCSSSEENYNVTIINESGLYALIFGSKLEAAKEFKHWVTSEVLPNIRKHGMYVSEDLLEDNERLSKQLDCYKKKNTTLTKENKELQRRFKKKSNEYTELINEWNENVDEFNETFDKNENLELELDEIKEDFRNKMIEFETNLKSLTNCKKELIETKKELESLKSLNRKIVKMINNKVD